MLHHVDKKELSKASVKAILPQLTRDLVLAVKLTHWFLKHQDDKQPIYNSDENTKE